MKLLIVTLVIVGSLYAAGIALGSYLYGLGNVLTYSDPIDAAVNQIPFSDGSQVTPSYQLQPAVNVMR